MSPRHMARKDDREKLDAFFYQVSSIILSKQNAATGLIPASVAITTHGDYTDAWVRDNVYSIMAVWGLGLAYKRIDDQEGRAYELENATIKCMRGLLVSMMRQAHKVELFKNCQTTMNCLHAKYNTQTGETVVGDADWGHLQIDATSIFLLNLAQMTVSGLSIVYTIDEVNFVQNLVFYIERAYRTPDYGIWERELNSSSIGMAVAALQAVNGINLFGARGGASSVIHVLPDEITRNYTTLHSSLPRESYSKEIDGALLSVISFPGFAVHDEKLIARTRNEILKKLGGKFGCKRFLRDGHQTVVEDHSRLHYDPHELLVFEGIECEWPLFFTYLILDGQFNNNPAQVEEFRNKLEPLLVDSENIPLYNREAQNKRTDIKERRLSNSKKNLPPAHMKLCPELYIVPRDKIQAEKETPQSQDRYPNENVPLVWAQSLLILGNLIHENLIDPADLDPLGRRFFPYKTDHGRDVVVQVVLLAENKSLQEKMAMFGLETQTIESCAPITISTDSALRDAYASLGENAKLKLTGRPKRPVGTLSTSKLYRCQGKLYAFLPHFMDREEYYLVSDNDYFVTVFEQELAFVRNNWIGSGRPTMVILLTKEMFGSFKHSQKQEVSLNPSRWNYSNAAGSSKKNLLDFMMSLRTGICGGVRVRLGRLSEMVNTSCIESLDFLVSSENSEEEDWHSVLRSEELARTTGRNLNLPEHESERKSSRSNTPNRKRSLRRNASRSQSPSKTPLTGTFFSEAASYTEFKLQDHVEISKHTRANGSNSPVRGSARERVMGSGPLIDDCFTPTEDRRNSFSFELNGNSSVTPSLHADRTAPADNHEAVILGNSTPLADHLDEKPSISSIGLIKPELVELDLLTLTLNDPSNFDHAVELLRNSSNLFDQIDILHYIYSIKGSDFQIENFASVRSLIEEVYVKAMHLKRWSIVRQAAGLLQKVVNNLSINITELLIRQKPVTVGFGKREVFINSPMQPVTLVEMIYKNCSSDVREAPLVQEIITYLGSFIRSSGAILDGIMRVRTHFFIIAMREEISRMKGCDEEDAIELLMQLSPYEMKSLLGQVLSAAEHLNLNLDPSATVYSTAARWHQIHVQHTVPIAGSPPVDGSSSTNKLKIIAQSGGYLDGNFARIEVERDGQLQQIPLSFGRGLNIVVLDPLDGFIAETANFDTHLSSEESDEFARMVEWLDIGTIVVVLSKDDCTENMTEAGRLACEEIGSRNIRELKYRDSWCIIGEKGGRGAIESFKASSQGSANSVERTIDLADRRQKVLETLPADCDLNSKDFFAQNMNLFLPSHGRWIRRRKNDGALNRVPPRFYPKVWLVLSQCEGIVVGKGHSMPRDPTISEKTPEEVSFGLQFESLLDVIRDPAERQMTVDTLVIIYWLSTSNPDVKMNGGQLNLLVVLKSAMQEHWNHWVEQADIVKLALEKNKEPTTSGTMLKLALGGIASGFEKNELFARRLFFDLPSSGQEGSSAYLARSCNKVVFDGKLTIDSSLDVLDTFHEKE